MNRFTSSIVLLLGIFFFCGCKKFLSEKSDKRLVIPTTLEDLQALMELESYHNSYGVIVAEMAADNYYLTTEGFNSLSAQQARNLYSWNGGEIFDGTYNDWMYAYRTIYYSTTVLDLIQGIERTSFNATQWDNIKGQALAARAFRYLSLVTTWSKAYNPETANADLGIPLRQTTDFSVPSVRVSVQETYDEIVKGLKEAIPLLPDVPLGNTRPGKPMAYATLSRAYLNMHNYEVAGRYADSALRLNNTLLDYNAVTSGIFPMAREHPEVIFQMYEAYYDQLLDLGFQRVDTLLYKTFEENDLRKELFFQENEDGSHSFVGNYSGNSSTKFVGISNAELYLTRAECHARAGRLTEAMDDLNSLLRHRWDATKEFIPLTAISQTEALETILLERRKELMFRGLRWPDIKRLNQEGANIILKRVVNGEEYILSPNDNRYALPIPEDIIELSGMPQNPQ